MEVSISGMGHDFRDRHPSVFNKRKKAAHCAFQASHAARAIDEFLNGSMLWASISCVLTLYALFIDDLRLIYFPKETDAAFVVGNWIVMSIFVAEWLLESIVRPRYACTLTSLLDLAAAVSLIPATELVQDETSVARITRTFRALRILRGTRGAAMALKTEATLKSAIAMATYRRGRDSDDRGNGDQRRRKLRGVCCDSGRNVGEAENELDDFAAEVEISVTSDNSRSGKDASGLREPAHQGV